MNFYSTTTSEGHNYNVRTFMNESERTKSDLNIQVGQERTYHPTNTDIIEHNRTRTDMNGHGHGHKKNIFYFLFKLNI